MRLAYKYRIRPTKIQAERLENSLNLLRDLYNGALQERRDAWKLNRIRVSYFDQTKQVPDIRKLNPDYKNVSARLMHQTLRVLDKSFSAFFRRMKAGQKAGHPRFKGKSFFNSIIYNGEGYNLHGGKLRLSFIGDLKIKLSRPIEGTIKEVVAKREGSKWYAIVSCDAIPMRPLPTTGAVVGIDVGIESFATLSDGTQIDNDRHYESSQSQLRVASRRVARRTKGSKRWRKAVNRLRSIHQKTFNRRDDFQHKLSTFLIANYDLIAVEKLNIKGMMRGNLSKQIADAGWHSFTRKLAYKAERAGRLFAQVNPAYTSQDCSDCGDRAKKTLKVRLHSCEKCGLSIHRDWNAALNILARA